jgi:hypothetical protein
VGGGLSNAQDGMITVNKVFCTDTDESVKWVLRCGTFVLFSGLYSVGFGVEHLCSAAYSYSYYY